MEAESKFSTFIDSIDNEKLDSIAEFIFDVSLESDLFKEIPIISTIIGAGQTVLNFRDKLFLRKILIFFKGLSTISQKERRLFIDKLDEKPKLKVTLSENLLLILDKITEIEKSELIAIAFKEFIQERITRDELWLVLTAIERTSFSDLSKIAQFENLNIHDDEIIDRYFISGICSFQHAEGAIGSGGSSYRKNRITDIMENVIIKAGI